MSEPNLAQDIKARRSQKGIGSRELSRLVGKAETYISQLERGLIKSPDYQTLFEIWKHLGYKEDKIEDMLYHDYYIMSPERIEADKAWTLRQIELEDDPEYQQQKLERDIERYEQEQQDYSEEQSDNGIDWLFEIEKELNKKANEIKDEFSLFIDKKLDVFEDVTKNFHSMVISMRKSKENYDFFTNLFKHDLTKLNEESKRRIIETVKEEYEKSHNYNGGWGKPPSF